VAARACITTRTLWTGTERAATGAAAATLPRFGQCAATAISAESESTTDRAVSGSIDAFSLFMARSFFLCARAVIREDYRIRVLENTELLALENPLERGECLVRLALGGALEGAIRDERAEDAAG
jgi:hypothetical protein